MAKKLQLALDFIDMEKALAVARKAADFVDILEAGTPLIKYNGIEAVRRLKKEFPQKLVAADMKIADVGALEVKIAALAGAEIITVMGAVAIETIEEAVQEAKNYHNVKIAADTIGVKDLAKRIKEIEKAKIDYLLIHCGIDEQMAGKDPMECVKEASKMTKLSLIAAGGINAQKAALLKEIPRVEIVIVGSAINKAEDPALAAKQIKQALK